MKILALSDIHGDKSFIKQMAEKGAKEKVDLVILAGDIVDFDGPSTGLVGPFLRCHNMCSGQSRACVIIRLGHGTLGVQRCTLPSLG